ncbi:methionine synthase (B12-dependent) [Baia soyae]|uniref:Methionine synthase n=1 Tax=Baia soyae TaxID=1544746 RepID=A0A4R2S0D2_9BACL|nr:methionine synthase (B12-dependent) [Baia soyae]
MVKNERPTLSEQLQHKILILDGAMGTVLQQANLTAADFGGESYDGCNEMLNLTRPDLIHWVHDSYFEAGADIVETNTFGATSVVLAEYDLQDKTVEINREAVRVAVEARDKWSTPDWPRYVAGAIGPTTKTLSVTGGITFEELADSYYEQAKVLIEAGVDTLLIETSQDTCNVKAAGIGVRRAFAELGKEIPIMISGTIEPMGTTLAGQNIEAFTLSLEHLKPLSIGLNCATGPEFMKDHLRTLSALTTSSVSCYPNAGLPDEEGRYLETPLSLAQKLEDFADAGWLNIVGGCCGTTPDHIREIAEKMKGKKPRVLSPPHGPAISGIDPVFIEADNRPLLVGERTNSIGSRKFKRLITEEKFDEASDIARRQVKAGAHVIDICLADPDRDEVSDMEQFLPFVTKKVKTPLMVDSTSLEVMSRALTFIQGKSILNSINLEDGETRFRETIPLIKNFGAAVVVGTIDEQGMGVTRERKLEVAKRSYQILVDQEGISGQDIIFDPLVFPVGTGDEQYIGSALETIEGIRLIKKELPECSTILGVSNVSFGLPPAGREVLNAVFLYECTKAGLDYAIVNTEKLERYASIPDNEKKLAEELLLRTNHDNYEAVLAEFTAFYRVKVVTDKKPDMEQLPLEERLARYVIEGSKDGLLPDLELALAQWEPLEIINGPLMAGMDEVGRLFNDNQLIVAEVLQSAEVMKASVAFLEPFMDRTDSVRKGKIILATVKGDVHDIGKNLVEIILANNGFEIINLGIKVPPDQIIEAARREKPDAIGLSGLLVKSAQQMVTTAQDLQDAGIDIPILVGGAALTRKFTETRIAPQYQGLVLYSKDAMNGLDLCNQLVNPTGRDQLEQQRLKQGSEQKTEQKPTAAPIVSTPIRSTVEPRPELFSPPDWDRHIYRELPLSELRLYLNEQMLFGHHLGLKGNVEKLLAEGNEKAVELKTIWEELWTDIVKNNWLQPKGVYQFFPVQSTENQVFLYENNQLDSPVRERFLFPRQTKDPYLCLSDFVRDVSTGEMDSMAAFAVTAGLGVRQLAQEWKEQGEYLRSHLLQATALEIAEACAERIHEMIRARWGFPDPVDFTMKQRFGARYRGIRVSFGYPACPDLEDQQKLFTLLKPEELGLQLTDGFMMEPEASVTAIVFSHPQARYFNAI